MDQHRPIEGRSDVDDAIAAAPGAATTTFELDFNARAIPLDTARLFFIVQENARP